MRVRRLLPFALALVAAGLAGFAVNLLLIDYASGDDRVGRLTPRAVLTGTDGSTTEETTTERTTTDDDD